MFQLWAQRGTAPKAQSILRELETARDDAHAIAEDQAKGIPAVSLQARMKALTTRLQEIQSHDPKYTLYSVGDLARTISSAKKKMEIVKPPAWRCPADRPAQLPIFKQQLRDQQDGINSMLSDSWEKNKKQYTDVGRTSEAKTLQKEFQKRSGHQKGTAAPHNSDGYSGGHKDPTGLPVDASVNSSIGTQWKGPPDRAKRISDAVVKIPELERLVTQMNVSSFRSKWARRSSCSRHSRIASGLLGQRRHRA